MTPDPITEQLTQLRARGDEDSLQAAAELEQEAEKHGQSPNQPDAEIAERRPRPRRATSRASHEELVRIANQLGLDPQDYASTQGLSAAVAEELRKDSEDDDAAATPPTAADPTAAPVSKSMTRDELEARAVGLGIDNPSDREKFPNKPELVAAIEKKQAPAPPDPIRG